MKIRITDPLISCSLTVVLGLCAYFSRRNPWAYIYRDSAGKEWEYTGKNVMHTATEFIVNLVPRGTYSLKLVEPNVDFDNSDYLESNGLIIVFCVCLAFVYAIYVVLYSVMKYRFDLCGGSSYDRRGYTEFQINVVRGTIVFESLVLAVFLIYGFFVNTDMDSVLKTLVGRFEEYAADINHDFQIIIDNLPNNTAYKSQSGASALYDRDMFASDMQVSLDQSSASFSSISSMVKTFETWRMLLIIVNLTCATVSCAIGIAAGSIRRTEPIVAMSVLSVLSCFFLFISTGLHFAGTKVMLEYCEASSEYTQPSYPHIIPQQFQIFVPCVNSPLYEFLVNYSFISALNQSDASFGTNGSSCTFCDSDNESNITSFARAIEQNRKCTKTKEYLTQEDFLLCTFTVESLEILTLSQFIVTIMMMFVSSTALSSIPMFKWAGTIGVGVQVGTKDGFIGCREELDLRNIAKEYFRPKEEKNKEKQRSRFSICPLFRRATPPQPL